MSSPPRKRRDPPAISLSKLASLLCPNDDPCKLFNYLKICSGNVLWLSLSGDDDNSWKCHCSACCPLHPASTVSSMLMKSVLSVKKSLLASSDQEDECCCVHGRYKCELGRSTSSEGLSIISNLEDSDICCTHGHQSCSVDQSCSMFNLNGYFRLIEPWTRLQLLLKATLTRISPGILLHLPAI